jgi:hypothetical protein
VKDYFYLLFLLAALLIAVVYYTGVKTDVGAFSSAFATLGDVFTGRNPATGQFANVPKQ